MLQNSPICKRYRKVRPRRLVCDLMVGEAAAGGLVDRAQEQVQEAARRDALGRACLGRGRGVRAATGRLRGRVRLAFRTEQS